MRVRREKKYRGERISILTDVGRCRLTVADVGRLYVGICRLDGGFRSGFAICIWVLVLGLDLGLGF